MIMYEHKRIKTFAKWVAQQRWNKHADIDEVCTRAEKVLNPSSAEHSKKVRGLGSGAPD